MDSNPVRLVAVAVVLLAAHPVLADGGGREERRFFSMFTRRPTTLQDEPEMCDCTCGERNFGSRIVGGDPADPNEFPWIVRLSYFNRFYCGGMLLNDRYVLTAAHCVKGFMWFMIKVTLGEHDRCDASQPRPETRFVLRAVTGDFSYLNFDNDIAILRLNDRVPMTDTIRPICLPKDDGDLYVGKKAIASGWGTLKEDGKPSCILQEVEVPVMANEECKTTNYNEKMISDNMMCAGYTDGGKDSCQGDSGGPLIREMDDKRFELIGVVSWGNGCARPGFPGIYTRVTRYVDWIKSNTAGGCWCQDTPKTATVAIATTTPEYNRHTTEKHEATTEKHEVATGTHEEAVTEHKEPTADQQIIQQISDSKPSTTEKHEVTTEKHEVATGTHEEAVTEHKEPTADQQIIQQISDSKPSTTEKHEATTEKHEVATETHGEAVTMHKEPTADQQIVLEQISESKPSTTEKHEATTEKHEVATETHEEAVTEHKNPTADQQIVLVQISGSKPSTMEKHEATTEKHEVATETREEAVTEHKEPTADQQIVLEQISDSKASTTEKHELVTETHDEAVTEHKELTAGQQIIQHISDSKPWTTEKTEKESNTEQQNILEQASDSNTSTTEKTEQQTNTYRTAEHFTTGN